MLTQKNVLIKLSLFAWLLGLSACSPEVSRLFAPDPELQSEQKSPAPIATPPEAQAQLPSEFPQEIPVYPEAELQSVAPNSTGQQGRAQWVSSDSSNRIETYYQEAFSRDNWDVEPGADEANNALVARRDNLQVTVLVSPDAQSNRNGTELAIAYQRQGDTAQSQQQTQTAPTQIAADPQEFADLEQVPEQLRQNIEDLAALGVLTSPNDAGTQQFNPDEAIARRDFARWLVAANNRLYVDRPGEQVRLASQSAEPAFSDVSRSDPDFAVIQGLAEAGIIPSPLSGDSSAVSFRPDAPLTREDLVSWKVPLDIRTALPSATIDSVKETWGFQDTSKISPNALRSLYADFQNGEQANVRRVFGYTTLFQPKKPVTRAEAAATLWYFGSQGEGISAHETRRANQQQNEG